MLDLSRYGLENTEEIETPALIFFKDIILHNTRAAIERAGGPGRLWPHVKSHKMRDMVRMQQDMGIDRFKCATISEAQMAADCGAAHILIAYPLIGPNIARFLRLQSAYPQSMFYAIGDNPQALRALARQAHAHGKTVSALLDINLGMNRTGVSLPDAEALYQAASRLKGLRMAGLHCYDGHIHDAGLDARREKAGRPMQDAIALRKRLLDGGYACDILVAGGTPTFSVHAGLPNVYLSPGTVFLGDGMCLSDVREQNIIPAAGVLTRVVSHPAPGLFTLDLGVKGLSTDQPGARGIIVGLPSATPLFQSEEHWVLRMPDGEAMPPVGASFLVIPTHICPTVALYPFAHVVSASGARVSRWPVTARDRNIGI